jgi:hypothetical protein
MDDERGGGALSGMLHADLRFVSDLLRHGSYRDDIGRRLHAAAAELARLAGWSAFDSGRHAAAQQYYLAALRSAAAVGDRSLGVNIVSLMGIQAYYTGRLKDATQLMDVATTAARSKSPAIVQAMAWARTGCAHANVGEPVIARKSLTKANRLLGRAVHGDAPGWSYWVDETRITAHLGCVLFDLGDYQGAGRELTTAVRSYGDAFPRDRATWLGRVATAQLRTGKLDEGCGSGRQAVDLLAGQVDSARGLGFLGTFRRELSEYQTDPVARDFIEYAESRLGASIH